MCRIATILLSLLFFSQNHFTQTDCKAEEILNEKSCIGDDISDQENELFNLVNEYRKQNNLEEISISKELCLVANRHALDLQKNIGTISHSWSDCAYVAGDPKTHDCILKAPKRFNPNFAGLAFENAFSTSGNSVSSVFALNLWKKSRLHNSLLINLDGFKGVKFNGGCVGIKDRFAVLWVSSEFTTQATKIQPKAKGLGVTFDQAIKGINKIVPIEKASSIIGKNRWVGTTPGESVIVEMLGTNEDIDESNISLRIKLESDKNLSVVSKHLLRTFLQNMAPKWKQRDQWLEKALENIRSNPKVVQTKFVRNLLIELSLTSENYIYLTVKPSNRPVPIEF